MRNNQRTWLVLSLAFICSVCVIPFCRGGDQGPDGTIDWASVTQTQPVVICSSETGKKDVCYIKAYLAITELEPTHVKTDEGDCLIHAHFEKDFGDTGVGVPTAQEANDYWDWRFGIIPEFSLAKTSRSGTPTTKTNCFAYAFSQVATAGPQTPYYENWLDLDAQKAFTDDVDPVGKYEVSAGDILQYNFWSVIYLKDILVHASVVLSTESYAGGKRPSSIKWKWAQSAIYSYTTPAGYAWDTPWNGCLNENIRMDEQEGGWEPAYPGYTQSHTKVYTPD
ncbi:MAG: hypothetical protein J7M19_10060 [Planctomycetes bacterium]|nr:hypothetical protein [Planctomycetota bacterium]